MCRLLWIVACLFLSVSVAVGCSNIATGDGTTPAARKRRSLPETSAEDLRDQNDTLLETMAVDADETATVSALTFFKFDGDSNADHADSLADQLREFVSTEQINESKFGKAERSLSPSPEGFLRVTYKLSHGGRHCSELLTLASKAIQLAEDAAEGSVTCGGLQTHIEKLDI